MLFRTGWTQHTAMAGSTAQQAAQHIAAALVGRQDAIGHHEGAAADVVVIFLA